LTSVFHVPAAKAVGSPKSSCAACRRARHWSSQCASRSHKPNNAASCQEIMCSHCGWHFAVPKSAPASGIHPYCASSVSRTASFSWHWCRSHVNNRPHEFRFYFHCLVHFLAREHMYGTSPGRRLRVGRAPCSYAGRGHL